MKKIICLFFTINLGICFLFASYATEQDNKYHEYEYVGMNMPNRAITDKIVEVGRQDFPDADVVIPVFFSNITSDNEEDPVNVCFRVYAYTVNGIHMQSDGVSEHEGIMKFGYGNDGFFVKRFKKSNTGMEISEEDWQEGLSESLTNYFMNFEQELNVEEEEDDYGSYSMSIQGVE